MKDKHPPEIRDDMEKQFKELNEAYGVLSDENKRQQYDGGADLEEIEQGGGGANYASGKYPG